MNKLKNLWYLTKWCFINLIISLIIFSIIFFTKVERDYGVIETNVSLLGFSLAAIGIFFAMPLRKEIRERLHQFQFDKIIVILMLAGMLSFLIGIIVYLFVDYFALNILFLFYGILQEVVATFYITKLFIKGR